MKYRKTPYLVPGTTLVFLIYFFLKVEFYHVQKATAKIF
jgi:hypothetical protein